MKGLKVASYCDIAVSVDNLVLMHSPYWSLLFKCVRVATWEYGKKDLLAHGCSVSDDWMIYSRNMFSERIVKQTKK